MWEHTQWALGALLGWMVRSLPARRRPPGPRHADGRSLRFHVSASAGFSRRPACRCDGVKPLPRPAGPGRDEEE